MIAYLIISLLFLSVVARQRYVFERAIAEMYAQENHGSHFSNNSHLP
jgi:hypothetical protein